MLTQPCAKGGANVPGHVSELCAQDASNNAADRLLAHRWYPGATLRPDGRILVTSGQDADTGNGCATPLFRV